jgi:16S rRNA (adenine1518-N6/adenine1519-N6)-dimethyltransferase
MMQAARHTPRRRFGQNFLNDAAIIQRIVAAIDPRADEHIVEIGPGLGALTDDLVARTSMLHVVEVDRDLCARLRNAYPPDRLMVHEGDALRFDFSSLPRPLRVVGNLPYNISTPLLFHLSEFADRISDMHFMLQREVVERMAAAPGSAAYGRLSVMLQFKFSVASLFAVPASAFKPAPKVESAIVRLRPLPGEKRAIADESVFASVVAAAFSHRRKTLKNALAGCLSGAVLSDLGIDPKLRPEMLSVADFASIARRAAAERGT